MTTQEILSQWLLSTPPVSYGQTIAVPAIGNRNGSYVPTWRIFHDGLLLTVVFSMSAPSESFCESLS